MFCLRQPEIAEAPAPDFHLDTRMGMPMNLKTRPAQPDVASNAANYGGEYDFDEGEYYDEEEEEGEDYENNQANAKTSVLEEALLPEKPPNWNEYVQL